MSHDTLLLRAAFVVAAVALVAAPYWRQVADFVAKAAKASVPYRADIARLAAAIALVAFGTGLVPVSSVLRLQSPVTVDSALVATRVALGLSLFVNAMVLLSRPAETTAQRLRRSSKDTLIALVLVAGSPLLPVSGREWKVEIKSPVVSPAVSAVVYVYEKDEASIPVGVSSAINRLNRERSIVASIFERDTVDGTGQTPDQFKPALDAAKRESIPSLIVLSGTSVVKVVKSPKTETEVLGAIP